MTQHRKAAHRLAELEAKKQQLAHRIAALSARQQERRRKDSDRRRELVGTIVLAELVRDKSFADDIRPRLKDAMRDTDWRLFTDLFDGDAS